MEEFDKVVRYGTDCPNTGYRNISASPSLTHPTQYLLFIIYFLLFPVPYSLFPIPCSLFPELYNLTIYRE
ncbi:hypothetical protein [Moorena producens]|uniref:hypothetical protein n=1 Tax=Moorena producens TaxID=1155739 RepID=UPI003C70EEFA